MGVFWSFRLTLSYIKFQYDQTYFKNLALFTIKIFKVCSAIFQHYAWKGWISYIQYGNKLFVKLCQIKPGTKWRFCYSHIFTNGETSLVIPHCIAPNKFLGNWDHFRLRVSKMTKITFAFQISKLRVLLYGNEIFF